jgi:DNA-binding IclR family transcriptional regulator
MDPVAGTASFSKFMHVLQLVADWPDAGEPPNVTALMRGSGYPRPTVHRIVAGLLAEGLLVELAPGTGWRSGHGSSSWRAAAGAGRNCGWWPSTNSSACATSPARPCTWRCRTAAAWSTSKSWKARARCGWLRASAPACRCIPPRSARPTWPALGAQALEPLLKTLTLRRYTDNTVTDRAALRKQLDATRERGWSVDGEENEAGIFCFGGVIRGHRGLPVAAISVSTLLFRQKENPEQAYVAPLLEACAAISARIADTPALAAADSL